MKVIEMVQRRALLALVVGIAALIYLLTVGNLDQLIRAVDPWTSAAVRVLGGYGWEVAPLLKSPAWLFLVATLSTASLFLLSRAVLPGYAYAVRLSRVTAWGACAVLWVIVGCALLRHVALTGEIWSALTTVLTCLLLTAVVGIAADGKNAAGLLFRTPGALELVAIVVLVALAGLANSDNLGPLTELWPQELVLGAMWACGILVLRGSVVDKLVRLPATHPVQLELLDVHKYWLRNAELKRLHVAMGRTRAD